MNITHAKATKLTVSLLFGLCAYGFLASAQAGESRLAPVQVRESLLLVDCATPQVPSQREIGEAFDVANLNRAYELRLFVRRMVTRACRFGADRVMFVRDVTKQDEDALRYVAMND